ncbi:MAG: ribbon-helix-helix domain-containing protein [Candidatus Nezhaarchaeales archaeon]|nr:MAG: hypothetical protein DSO05_06155 [Candidatus Nezhaarchaeota archaeon WYZ-LMO7]
MPLTTVDIPKDIIDYLDDLIARGVKRSRKEVVLEALRYYRMFTMEDWNPPRYQLGSVKLVFLNVEGLFEVAKEVDGEKLVEAGRRAGYILRDHLIANLGFKLIEGGSWEEVFEFLKNMGWGVFRRADDKILASNLSIPAPLIQGYLEALLGIRLRTLPTKAQDVAIFEIEKGG